MRRFDREGKQRIPFLSAMSMLGSKDNEGRSYLEIVDALRQHGAAPKANMEALWRRLVFNILISNTDDHLRNHGFLYAGQEGWRLSPAYDLNPVPTALSRASSARRSTRMTTQRPSHWPWKLRGISNWTTPQPAR